MNVYFETIWCLLILQAAELIYEMHLSEILYVLLSMYLYRDFMNFPSLVNSYFVSQVNWLTGCFSKQGGKRENVFWNTLLWLLSLVTLYKCGQVMAHWPISKTF